MTKKEKLEYKVQSRITQSQKEKLDELDVNLREIIDYYIVHNTNPTLELKNRQMRLLREIKQMENELSEKKEELKEVNLQLGVRLDENIATLEVSTIGERIKDNCQKENDGKCDKRKLADFIMAGRGKHILKHGLSEYNIRDKEKRRKFIDDVFKYLAISDANGIDKLEI